MSYVSIEWLVWVFSLFIGYWALPARFRDLFVVLLTFCFLASAYPQSAAILLSLTTVSYFGTRGNRYLYWRALAIAAAVIITLGYFKLRVPSNRTFNLETDVLYPLGLSYYAFRIIHYLIERARGTLPQHNFIDYISYQFFLPTIVVGPINRFPEFLQQRRTKEWNAGQLSAGLERVVFGYFKIAVLGNTLISKYAMGYISGLDPVRQKAASLYLSSVAGSFNLYFQFSGYSDVAIGLSLLLGYKISENFNWPFLATNIGEFWRRWHISLTSWSREYIFLPVVGLSRSPILAAISSLLLIGVWHEWSLRYVVWGLYHGVGVAVVTYLERLKRNRNKGRKKPTMPPQPAIIALADRSWRVLLTAHYFFFGYLIVRLPTLMDVPKALWTMLFFWWTP